MKRQQFSNQDLCPKWPSLGPNYRQFISWTVWLHFDTTEAGFRPIEPGKTLILGEKWIFIYRIQWPLRVTVISMRKYALEIKSIVVVPSWLDKYNNCHPLLYPCPTQSDEFSFTKVQDVMTNCSAWPHSFPGLWFHRHTWRGDSICLRGRCSPHYSMLSYLKGLFHFNGDCRFKSSRPLEYLISVEIWCNGERNSLLDEPYEFCRKGRKSAFYLMR